MIFEEKDVGNYVIDKNGIAFKVIAFSEIPSVTIENTETRIRQHFADNCLTSSNFIRLKEEEDKK